MIYLRFSLENNLNKIFDTFSGYKVSILKAFMLISKLFYCQYTKKLGTNLACFCTRNIDCVGGNGGLMINQSDSKNPHNNSCRYGTMEGWITQITTDKDTYWLCTIPYLKRKSISHSIPDNVLFI